jgi:hypothetical protein
MEIIYIGVTVEPILSPKNAMSAIGFDPGTSRTVSHRSSNWSSSGRFPLTQLAEDGFEPTRVLVTLGRGACPL